MVKFRGKELRVDAYDGVWGVEWFALVKDQTGKETEGDIRHFKLHAWLDAFRLAW